MGKLISLYTCAGIFVRLADQTFCPVELNNCSSQLVNAIPVLKFSKEVNGLGHTLIPVKSTGGGGGGGGLMITAEVSPFFSRYLE